MLSNYAFLAAFVLFIMFLAVKGTLSKYIELLFYTPAEPKPETPKESGSSGESGPPQSSLMSVIPGYDAGNNGLPPARDGRVEAPDNPLQGLIPFTGQVIGGGIGMTEGGIAGGRIGASLGAIGAGALGGSLLGGRLGMFLGPMGAIAGGATGAFLGGIIGGYQGKDLGEYGGSLLENWLSKKPEQEK